MISLTDIEKKINSELTTKIKSSKIKHNQLYLNIDPDYLLEVIFYKGEENEISKVWS